MAVIRRRRQDALTIGEVAARWGRSVRFVQHLVYGRKILAPIPSSRGKGRGGLLFTLATVQRVERDYEGIRRDPEPELAERS